MGVASAAVAGAITAGAMGVVAGVAGMTISIGNTIRSNFACKAENRAVERWIESERYDLKRRLWDNY